MLYKHSTTPLPILSSIPSPSSWKITSFLELFFLELSFFELVDATGAGATGSVTTVLAVGSKAVDAAGTAILALAAGAIVLMAGAGAAPVIAAISSAVSGCPCIINWKRSGLIVYTG